MAVGIPARLTAACQKSDERLKWLASLPDLLLSLEQRWSLTLGDPFNGEEGSCAWVAPVTLASGVAAALKVGMPHMEAEDEIAGLRFWDGNPTVQLLNADDDAGAMLLERCEPGTALRETSEPEQDVVIATLMRRLWRRPSVAHVFRPLSAMTEYWSNEAIAQQQHWPDTGLVSEGLRLFKELSQSASGDVLLATDLHAGNVLRAQREPWLVIDPKPFVGDPAYDATQHLLNCYHRLHSDPRRIIGRLAELLELDHERVRLWTFARTAVAAGTNCENPKWLALARSLDA